MKFPLLILTILFSVSALAQPSVSGSTAPAADTIVFLPQTSIMLTGTAVRANPGHPILDTTWTQTSGPAATITDPSNRMTTKVTGLSVGAYVFKLTATDKSNSATASVKVTVISGILPATFGYVHASRNDQGILLKWQTSMESNNSAFVIQRSTDGLNYADIAIIHTQAKNGSSSVPLSYSCQLYNNGTYAGMQGLLLFMTILAGVVLISRSNKTHKCLMLAVTCLFLFSCTKSVIAPDKASTSSKTMFRIKQVNLDNQVSYSEVVVVN
jgi:hypothetical protein